MNHWKDELKQAFEIPLPVRKQEFIRQLPTPKISNYEFLISQIGYIRKWVWYISTFVFLISILGLTFLPNDILWLISGLTPLLALTIISESGRSEYYNMAELEMATRFSLKNVILARLSVLGISNLLLLSVLIPIGLWNNTLNPFAAGLYILTPFLLTTFIGLYIVRKFKGREIMYACVGITLGISFSVFISHNIIPFIYQENYLVFWTVATLALLIENSKYYIAIMKRTEELTWNLL